MIRFFRSLRGKLILTYTTVTVLALLALEVIALILTLVTSSLNNTDVVQYISDIYATLSPQARVYLNPGEENTVLLQDWLQQVYRSGYASLEPQNIFDSPAAKIVPGDPMYVLSMDQTVIAQAQDNVNNLIGRKYTPPNIPNSKRTLESALAGSTNALEISTLTPSGDYYVAVPVFQAGSNSSQVGVIVLTVEASPSLLQTLWPYLFSLTLLTGFLLLLAVAPFGAIFGFVMSAGLTRRLNALTRAADAWSEGNFSLLPQDRSQDEIGYLGMRMRNMAERIQSLMQSQHQLALMEERNRLARELHDTVKQQTFATLMQVRAAKNLLEKDPAQAYQRLDEAEGLIKTSQQELGRMIAELRPAALEDQGLATALKQYVDSWSQQVLIPAVFQVQNERRVPLDIELSMYRIAQEALANVARHSHASQANVRLVYNLHEMCLEVSDNGVGFDHQAGQTSGFGLRSMGERAAQAGGKLAIEVAEDGGTILSVKVPLGKQE